MVKRFTIQPVASNQIQSEHSKTEEPYDEKHLDERDKSIGSSSIKYWLLGGLCVGLALGLFTKRM
jgi:hypothetical protein